MITIYNDLNEIDSLANLEAICAHIDANGWVHLYNEIDYVKHLEEKNAELLRDKEKLQDIAKRIESAIQEIDKTTIKLLNFVEGKPVAHETK